MRVLSLLLCEAQQTLQCLTTMASCRNFSPQLPSAKPHSARDSFQRPLSVRYGVSNRLEMYNFEPRLFTSP